MPRYLRRSASLFCRQWDDPKGQPLVLDARVGGNGGVEFTIVREDAAHHPIEKIATFYLDYFDGMLKLIFDALPDEDTDDARLVIPTAVVREMTPEEADAYDFSPIEQREANDVFRQHIRRRWQRRRQDAEKEGKAHADDQ